MHKRFDKSLCSEPDPETVLNQSDLLIKENCIIHNNVVYEKLFFMPTLDVKQAFKYVRFRYFFSVDDYDYVDQRIGKRDIKMYNQLIKLFKNKKNMIKH